MAPKAKAADAPETTEEADQKVLEKKDFEDRKEKISNEIDAVTKEIDRLQNEIGGQSKGKDSFFEEKKVHNDNIQKCTTAINELHDIKKKIQDQLGEMSSKLQTDKDAVKDKKKSLKHNSVEEINREIARIDHDMTHGTHTLMAEKEMMITMKKLNASKKLVSEVYKAEAQHNEAKAVHGEEKDGLREQKKAIAEEIKNATEARSKHYDARKVLQDARDEQMGGVKELVDKKNELFTKKATLIEERKELQNYFKKAELEKKAEIQKAAQLRQEAARARKSQDDKAWEEKKIERALEKLDDKPHQNEIKLIEQSIKFCKTFMPKETQAEETKKEIEHTNPDTHLVLASKASRDDEFYYNPTKSKKKKGGKKASGPAQITHNAVTFKIFLDLGLKTPTKVEEIADTLAQLDEKMAHYDVLIKKWEDNKEAKKKQILAGNFEEPKQEPVEEPATEAAADENAE